MFIARGLGRDMPYALPEIVYNGPRHHRRWIARLRLSRRKLRRMILNQLRGYAPEFASSIVSVFV